jgi:hypothetical protein
VGAYLEYRIPQEVGNPKSPRKQSMFVRVIFSLIVLLLQAPGGSCNVVLKWFQDVICLWMAFQSLRERELCPEV